MKNKKDMKGWVILMGKNSGARINQVECNKIADSLEEYLFIIDRYIILTEISDEDYIKSVNKIKKAISRLRSGKNIDKVLDIEEFEEYMNRF